jgi:predicted transcriptional regulator
MKSRHIRAWLILHGITQTQVALDLGVGRSMVSMFIDGQKTSRRVYRHFVEVLGMPKSYFKKYSEMDEAA